MNKKVNLIVTFALVCILLLPIYGGNNYAYATTAVASEEKGYTYLEPMHPGEKTLGNSKVTIDVSNTSQGYMMIKYTGSNSKPLMQLTKSGGTTYTYYLTKNEYITYPFSNGDGKYTINIFENISGTQYSTLCTETVTVKMENQLLPFLYPNQYVNFAEKSKTVAKGAELAKGAKNDFEIVEKVYNYTVNNIVYDTEKAKNIKSGYLPVVDDIVASGKGICFDYAAVMIAMLRTQNIPAKLHVGYSGKIYHAWLSVYIKDVGWIDGVIYFDGKSWVRMDPTFASSGKRSKDILNYIGNGSNYNPIYVY